MEYDYCVVYYTEEGKADRKYECNDVNIATEMFWIFTDLSKGFPNNYTIQLKDKRGHVLLSIMKTI